MSHNTQDELKMRDFFGLTIRDMDETDQKIRLPDSRTARPHSPEVIAKTVKDAKRRIFLDKIGIFPSGLEPDRAPIGHEAYINVLRALAGE